MEPVTFTITGTFSGRPATVTWTEGSGFDDPEAVTGASLALGTQVCATATGPCFAAADRPAVVAYLTAAQAFDEIASVDDPFGVLAQLEELCAVPPGATA